MSRCLPYQPRGYKREDVSLIGSIKKLQKGRGNACLTEEVCKKNENKSKKRSREEHNKPKFSENNKKKSRHDQKAAKPHESFHEAGKDPSEQLEGSGLSEEHEAPASVLNSCHSLETTQNNSKMKSSQDSLLIRKSHGLILRIKLPLKKHDDKHLQPATASTEPCYSSQQTSSENVHSSKPANPPKLQDLQSLPANEQPRCFNRITEEASVLHPGLESKSESCFRNLILNWKPPTLQLNETDICDEDWLFSTRHSRPAEPITKSSRVEISDRTSCSASAGNPLQPRACYLPECDAYQLPYVIPF